MDIMMKHEEFLDALAKIGNGPLSDTTLKACDKLICMQLVWESKVVQCECGTPCDLPANICKEYGNPLHYIKGVNPSSMPPCAKVLGRN